jgi:ankyrin repeat protein
VAAFTGGQATLAALLLDNGACVDARSLDGWTPLMAACFGGHLDAAALLLSRGGSRSCGGGQTSRPLPLVHVAKGTLTVPTSPPDLD